MDPIFDSINELIPMGEELLNLFDVHCDEDNDSRQSDISSSQYQDDESNDFIPDPKQFITIRRPGDLSEDGLKNWDDLSSDEESNMCSICSTTFDSTKILFVHFEKHFFEYDCSKCKKSFCTMSSLNGHMNKMHPAAGKNYLHNCPQCNKVFEKPSQLGCHMRVHLDDNSKSFKCSKCSKKYSSVRSVRRHFSKAHPSEKPYRCGVCNKGFTDSTVLKNHIRTHDVFI